MKSAAAITLIVDTNLFLECSPLAEIQWEDLGFAEISLIVPRPVQQEIDNHKKGVKGRTFKKALAATALFREIVVGGGKPTVVREAGPRVTLALMAQSKIDPTLAEDLDPDFNDDAIILRMLQYARDNPQTDVRLLTHDTGPMATAQSVGAGFVAIPNEWLSNEYDDPTAKANRKLEAELKRLQSQEPIFSVSAQDRTGTVITRIDAEVDHHDELSSDEINELIAELQAAHSLETDFGSAETTPPPATISMMRRITVTEFEPAKQTEIENYQSVKYPEWLEECRSILRSLHQKLNSRTEKPIIRFVVTNTGTRPAAQSLVRFIAKGDIRILPEPKQVEDEAGNETVSSKPLRLPFPPRAPRGRWITKSGIRGSAFDFAKYGDPFGTMSSINPRFDTSPFLPRNPTPRDPDKFYYKGGRPRRPDDIIELTCENWRHNIEPELFEFEIYRATTGDVSGALKIEVHAENLTDPAQMIVPLSFKEKAKSTLDMARMLLRALD